ncbi:MAG: ATP synthase F1 subunit gamma [Bacteroidota bacterium]
MGMLREIRRRITGTRKTQQITKAMKMVAAAKLRRAQENILSARPYARKMNELLQHLVAKVDPHLHPLLVQREVQRVALVVVTADRGLCGAFNANLLRTAVAHIDRQYQQMNREGRLMVVCVGRKGFEFFKKRLYNLLSSHIHIFNVLDFSHAVEIVTKIADGYLKGGFDKVEVVYNEFKSVIQQRVVIEQFLPIPAEEVRPSERGFVQLVDYIYEPSSKEIVDALVPKHLNFQMWRMLLESNAAEQGARMTAMANATENARELIDTLLLSFNKARQAAITKEILEVVSGAEALKTA